MSSIFFKFLNSGRNIKIKKINICFRQLPRSVTHILVGQHVWRPTCPAPMPGRYPSAKSTPLGQKETEQHTVGRKVAAVRGPCSKYAGLVDNSLPALPSGSSGQYGLGPY